MVHPAVLAISAFSVRAPYQQNYDIPHRRGSFRHAHRHFPARSSFPCSAVAAWRHSRSIALIIFVAMRLPGV